MKSKAMEEFLNNMTKSVHGRERDGSCCVTCGSTKVKPEDFRKGIHRREFSISFMCQVCQDKIFGVGNG